MQRISVLLATGLTACAMEPTGLATLEQAETLTKHESRRCDVNLCILHWERDSDHDGISDEDELAAGTDPKDPLAYPAIVDLLGLVPHHALPSFEIGNSLFVLLPTTDANGLPIYGGASLLPARKSSLETAGISVPGEIDISRGFTMSRGWKSHGIAFNTLLTAFGREDKQLPVRLLANAIGHADHTRPFTVGHAGAKGTISSSDHRGTVAVEGNISQWSADGSNSSSSGWVRKNADGSSSSEYQNIVVKNDDLWRRTIVSEEKSADGKHSVRVVTTSYIEFDKDGNPTEVPFSTTVEVCDNGTCETFEEVQPTEAPSDPNNPIAYIDPIAAESGGIVGAVTTGAMHAAATESKTTLVVQDWTDPLSTYVVPPTGIYDRYGKIALYGGDPENMDASATAGVPTFVRLPSPETDVHHSDRMPTTDAPPDRTCMYCAQ